MPATFHKTRSHGTETNSDLFSVVVKICRLKHTVTIQRAFKKEYLIVWEVSFDHQLTLICSKLMASFSSTSFATLESRN